MESFPILVGLAGTVNFHHGEGLAKFHFKIFHTFFGSGHKRSKIVKVCLLIQS